MKIINTFVTVCKYSTLLISDVGVISSTENWSIRFLQMRKKRPPNVEKKVHGINIVKGE